MATLLTPLQRATQVGSTRPAVTCGEVQLTYAQTWDRCLRLIGALRALGVQDGDRVGVVGPSGAGKLLKRELREPFWAGVATRVAGA
jgi:acyl-CoA synthetase (AMP-forming)/AMP-acid ligase II